MKTSGIVIQMGAEGKCVFCYNRWEENFLLFLYLKIVFLNRVNVPKKLTFFDIYVWAVKIFQTGGLMDVKIHTVVKVIEEYYCKLWK